MYFPSIKVRAGLDSHFEIGSAKGRPVRFAIQGEHGSNSHAAALAVAASRHIPAIELLACTHSADVFEAVEGGSADLAVLPIENSLHGSVAEHYDLLLTQALTITGESLLPIRHNLIAAPGVALAESRQVLSHPVALSQCRRWLREHPAMAAVPHYDTAGSVKHLMSQGLRDTAGIAPALAAECYGAQILVAGMEDHAENYTRFLALERTASAEQAATKLSIAFSLEHRPGTLLAALGSFAGAGLNLTRIESRPVPGRPWEYIFFADIRFEHASQVESALAALRPCCQMVKELGRYRAA
jgi:prephenate dehydratase